MKNYLCKYKLHYMMVCAIACLIVVVCLPESVVMASSATVWFETSKDEIREGEEFKVYMYIDADEPLGDFSGTLSYNDDVLEYKSGPACITGGDGGVEIQDIHASESKDVRQYAMTFKALKRGNSLIQLIYTPEAYEYGTQNIMSLSSSVLMIEIHPSVESSTNAKLSVIKISPGTLTPSFSPDVFEYETIVSAETDKLVVSAIPEDLLSDVSVTGNNSLKYGDNNVQIIVQSPSGEELTYVIHVFKEGEEVAETEPDADSDIDETNTMNDEWRFEVTERDGTTLISGQYYYKVREKTADITIPEGYYRTKMIINKVPINIYAKNGGEESEFFLLVLENEAGEAALYRYDRIEKTVQRYFDETKKSNSQNSRLEDQMLLQDAIDMLESQQNVATLSLLTALSCGISVCLLVVIVILLIKLKDKDDELDY